MRAAKTEAEVNHFKDGIVRIMSNLSIYTVKQQYMENKEMWDNQPYSIHEHGQDDAAEGGLAESDPLVESLPHREEDESEAEEATKEESASKFPFFW